MINHWILFAVFAVSCFTVGNVNGYEYDYQDDDVINDPEVYDDNLEENNLKDDRLSFDENILPEPSQVDLSNRNEIFQDDHFIANQEDTMPEEKDLANGNDDADKEVIDEINEFRKTIEDSDQNMDPVRTFDYYQFEDNRSKQNNEDFDSNEEFEESIPIISAQEAIVDEDDQNVFDETRSILNEDTGDLDEDKDIIQNEDALTADTNSENEENIPSHNDAPVKALDDNDPNILEETRSILNEDANTNSGNQFDDDIEDNENVYVPDNEVIQSELSFQQLDDILDKIDQNSDQSVEDSKIDLNQEIIDDLIYNFNENIDVDIPENDNAQVITNAEADKIEENFTNERDSESAEAIVPFDNEILEKLDDAQVIANGEADETEENFTNEINSESTEDIVPFGNEIPEKLDDAQVIVDEEADKTENNFTNERDSESSEDIVSFSNKGQIDDVESLNDFLPDSNDDRKNEQNSHESEQIYDANNNSPLIAEGQNDLRYEEQQQNVENTDDDSQDWNENQDQEEDVSNFNSDEFDEYEVNNILTDLNGDLKSLFETLDKLNMPDPEDKEDEVQTYELENERPYGEDMVLSQREDEDLAPVDSQENDLEEDNIEEVEGNQKVQKSEIKKQDYDWERSLEEHFTQNNVKQHDIYKTDEIVEDQLTNEEQSTPKETSEKSQESTTTQIFHVEDLTNSQYDDLMKQFSIVYSDDLGTQAKGFERDVAPIHMKISVDEPTVVTSPYYPDAYPTNNIVDWIFDGEGTGIEFNVTDLALNGVLGDYLLVKPGAEDETGTDGLLFSYTLGEPRNYRFFDVDKLFVRFESKIGLAFSRGFKFSVKMINPLPEDPELEPETAPLLPTPTSTLTVSLGGISAQDFLPIREDFRQLIADMATMYINANYIELGINTTSETTQITYVAVCNINWPGFENCAQVSFGVPLVYQDDRPARLDKNDLLSMWTTYIGADPFAQRLKRMGIEEFAVPDDSHVLMVWLVIGAGVLISAAMLALALWRFSCFEDYTRMPVFSDSDSIMNEKRGLDLYPTPHQTLPPLYADPDSKDFKWEENFGDSTRVDMGGYANRSFTRDELYDIESDEDNMMTTRDRTSITPRDIYKV